MSEPAVAIVTGAARGIGAATAQQLAGEGWRVIALDVGRDDARLPYALGSAAELRAMAAAVGGPGTIEPIVADAGDADALQAVIADASAAAGGIDAFIACAGVIAGGVPAWELDPEAERAVLDTCLHAVLLGARLAIPALLARPEPRAGRFLAVASTAALRGLPMLAAYCAAKAGVVGLVRALATELAGTGVTANAVCPGSTRTRILDESARLYGLPDAGAFAAQQPLQRLLEPDEVAAMLVWLAGPAGAAVTGAALPVDGGLSI